MDSMNNSSKDSTPHWGECYFDHFEIFLGQPIERNIFEQSSSMPPIQIIRYDNIFDGCRAFCSFGLSSYVNMLGERAEIFMPVDDGWCETPAILANALFFMIQQKMKIGWGLTIDFKNVFPSFVEKFTKSAIYLSVPFGVPPEFNKLTCGMQTGSVYLASYISELERQYFLAHGAEKFESLLEEKSVDSFHIARNSSI